MNNCVYSNFLTSCYEHYMWLLKSLESFDEVIFDMLLFFWLCHWEFLFCLLIRIIIILLIWSNLVTWIFIHYEEYFVSKLQKRDFKLVLMIFSVIHYHLLLIDFIQWFSQNSFYKVFDFHSFNIRKLSSNQIVKNYYWNIFLGWVILGNLCDSQEYLVMQVL